MARSRVEKSPKRYQSAEASQSGLELVYDPVRRIRSPPRVPRSRERKHDLHPDRLPLRTAAAGACRPAIAWRARSPFAPSFVLVLVLVLWTIGMAQPARAQAELPDALEIKGAETTREAYLRAVYARCVADAAESGADTNVTQGFVTQCLLNERIFESVEIGRDETGKTTLTVKEKATFFPVPYVSISGSGERRFGAFIVDFNAFGGKELALLGGYVADNGYYGFARFENKKLMLTDTALVGTLTFGRRVFELEQDDEIRDKIDEERISVGGELGHRFGAMTPSVQAGYVRRVYREEGSYPRPGRSDGIRMGVNLEFDAADYKLYYEDGLKARASGSWETPFENQRTTQILSTQLFGGISPWFEHAASAYVTAAAVGGGNGRERALRLGGGRGYRGIRSQTLWVSRSMAGSAEYHVPAYRATYGIWTLAGFGELGRSKIEGGRGGITTHTAYGAGVYLYFKGLAIPGIGVEAGSNHPFEKVFTNVTLGVSI